MPSKCKCKNKNASVKRKKIAKGLTDRIINNLPFEMHIGKDYQFCGPGTKLQERLKKGQTGVFQQVFHFDRFEKYIYIFIKRYQ